MLRIMGAQNYTRFEIGHSKFDSTFQIESTWSQRDVRQRKKCTRSQIDHLHAIHDVGPIVQLTNNTAGFVPSATTYE
jgi:hypothetical protein